ncbi:hypothetical protein FHU32_001338 [Corynebacterium bovis DSM 20582 = CIP 54.80]|uniref:Uncharacterized protein n=1 Tax=Corynebacterium bovis DSM 20582 = CIP 54.80 TaxID=927655 RepID=A0A8H9YBQ1_9CORY|nr:hypothetical protein [Corynebacterium bovis DSM 20582 = CIP 54.80]
MSFGIVEFLLFHVPVLEIVVVVWAVVTVVRALRGK